MADMLSCLQGFPESQAIALGFIATTPAFLFQFTTYNNDSLATLLSIASTCDRLRVAFLSSIRW